MLPQNLKQEISSLSKTGQSFKPHKYIALLAAIDILRKAQDQSINSLYFNDDFKTTFSYYFKSFASPSDRDRPSAPFFHLKSASFWQLVPCKGMAGILKNLKTVGSSTELITLVSHAEISSDFLKIIHDPLLCSELISFIEQHLQQNMEHVSNVTQSNECSCCNHAFVSYLNSLLRLSAGNENSLAEFQACNQWFKHIQVEHFLIKTITDELQNVSGRHVILTGHAGDGKSTVALGVFKRLKGYVFDEPLKSSMLPRETLEVKPRKVVILKDFSERVKDEDSSLMNELRANKVSFLLVSNTGALLDFFNNHATVSAIDAEKNVLNAINSDRGYDELKIHGLTFQVFNLAQINNLKIARQIFEKMLTARPWQDCATKACSSYCHIHRNVSLINKHRESILKRMFLVYQRLYEYGSRLTMRQLTEHFAYVLTAGIGSDEIKPNPDKSPATSFRYMFFNNFFSNVFSGQTAGSELKAHKEMIRQGLPGSKNSKIERHGLWWRACNYKFKLAAADFNDEFQQLLQLGNSLSSQALEALKRTEARDLIRKALFFLHDFSAEESDYLGNFLASPAILKWVEWQKGYVLKAHENAHIKLKIRHALQEYFIGAKIPVVALKKEARLYVTLGRKNKSVQQRAQVLLADFDWDRNFRLSLHKAPMNCLDETRCDLRLSLFIDEEEKCHLSFPLPFLDFVIKRHLGEISESLQSAYVERLEQFKVKLSRHGLPEADHKLTVLSLTSSGQFTRKQFRLDNGFLEVNDA